ncbi:hypothetical protein [Phenylobacterium aquaticum]|uniref:hypothetical protein n=1 Tax=Phenylobacterium aquaticum TaxID=1763816 RepID=UPI0026F2641B|nr:hypothetical protein [Phenylobacterium aquaticum]
MTDIESFKRRTGVTLDYRQFDIDALAPAPILQAPPAEVPAVDPAPPAPPGPVAAPPSPPPAAPPASGFSRYAYTPARPTGTGTPLADLFRRLERK